MDPLNKLGTAKEKTFREEYILMLQKSGIEYDERYLD
jgi:hypothetical protein